MTRTPCVEITDTTDALLKGTVHFLPTAEQAAADAEPGNPAGVQSGAISDAAFTASSTYGPQCAPHTARLHLVAPVGHPPCGALSLLTSLAPPAIARGTGGRRAGAAGRESGERPRSLGRGAGREGCWV